MSRNVYFHQNPRRANRRIKSVGLQTKIYPRSQHHFDLIKHNIAEGVSSATGLFDEAETPGSVDYDGSVNPFSARVDKLSLANALLSAGGSKRDANSLASAGSSVSDVVEK